MSGYCNYSALCAAVAHNDVNELAESLTLRGARGWISVPNKKGITPLHRASSNGYTQIVKLLVEAGVSTNTPDKSGNTALHWASYYGYLEIVKLLVEADANVNAADKCGRTPLHEASSRRHLEVVKLLVEAGANIDATDEDGKTPRQLALDEGYNRLANYLNDISQQKQRSLQFDAQSSLTPFACLPDSQSQVSLAELRAKFQRLQAVLEANEKEMEELCLQKDVRVAELERRIQALESAPPSASTTCTTSRELGGDTTSLTAAEVRLMQTIRELEARVAQLQAVVDQPNCIPYGVFGWPE